MEKNKKYRFKVGPKKGLSNEVSITTGVPDLTVTQKDNHLVLKWNKIKKSKGYYIYRGTSAKAAQNSKKPYQKIGNEKTVTFTDKKCKRGVEYYYVVRAKKGTKKTSAKKGTIIDKEYNLKYAKNSDLFKNVAINNNANWKANNYTLPNGTYPPIKYRFTGRVLEIHLYLDFVQYNKNGNGIKRKNDPQEKLSNKLCSNLFIEGLKEGFNGIRVTSGKGNFGGVGVAFDTKLIVHKARCETYNPAQRFIEVRIGGLSPQYVSYDGTIKYVDFDGDLWFHAYQHRMHNDSIYLPYIHMPTNAQLKNNTGKYKNLSRDAKGYKGTAAHEMGHVLGLDDAYSIKNNSGRVTADRCADNSETCKKVEGPNEYSYYALMKGGYYLEYVKMRANDIEMMLYAYSLSENGIPQSVLQSYNSYSDGHYYEISDKINNKKDEHVEK